jgi:hypothetical protein
MVDDKIFMNINYPYLSVTKDDIEIFNRSVIENTGLPECFTFETADGYFKIDRVNKIFKILKRKEKETQQAQHDSDVVVMMLYKIAKRCGYKCSLENKYMN